MNRHVAHLDAEAIAELLDGSVRTAEAYHSACAAIERNVLERAAELLRAGCATCQPDHPEAVDYHAAAAELSR